MAESTQQKRNRLLAARREHHAYPRSAGGDGGLGGDRDAGPNDLAATCRPGSSSPRRPARGHRRAPRRLTTGFAATRRRRSARGSPAPAAGRTRSGRPTRATACACASQPPSPTVTPRRPTRRRPRSSQPSPTCSRTVPSPDTCIEVTPTGPGQGTFTSGTQTSAGSEPAAGDDAQLHRPVPGDPHRRPLQGQAHDAQARHREGAEGARIQARCKGTRLPVHAQGHRRASSSASARCSAPIARRRRSSSGSRSRKDRQVHARPDAPGQGARCDRPLPDAGQDQAGEMSRPSDPPHSAGPARARVRRGVCRRGERGRFAGAEAAPPRPFCASRGGAWPGGRPVAGRGESVPALRDPIKPKPKPKPKPKRKPSRSPSPRPRSPPSRP